MQYLGQISDTKQMKYFCPEKKKMEIFKLIDKILRMRRIHVRKLAKIYGKLVSNRFSLGDIVRLMSRYGFNLIASAPTWDSYVNLTEGVFFELKFFKEKWDSLNGCPIKAEKTRIPVMGGKIEVASDAIEDRRFCLRGQ